MVSAKKSGKENEKIRLCCWVVENVSEDMKLSDCWAETCSRSRRMRQKLREAAVNEKSAKKKKLKVTVVSDQAAWVSCVKEEQLGAARFFVFVLMAWSLSWWKSMQKVLYVSNVAFWVKRGVSCLTFVLTEAKASAKKTKKQKTIHNTEHL